MLVATSVGYTQIQNIRAGMSVVSRNPETGEVGLRTVSAQYSNPYPETVYITAIDAETGATQTIVSNRIHPMFVQTLRAGISSSEGHVYTGPIANGHWIDAADIEAGDRLLNDDGSWAEVASVTLEAEALVAYNLTVDDWHTYFVAGDADAEPVWVHNDCNPDDLINNGGRQLDDDTIIGVHGNRFERQPDGTFKQAGRATPDEISASGVVTQPRVDIRAARDHHNGIVGGLREQFEAQGYRVSDREISFGDSCGPGRCRPDLVVENDQGQLVIFEVKTGDADLSIRQSEIFPQINSGDAIPRGPVAAEFGLIPNRPLRDQGYPDGIPIIQINAPRAGGPG